MENRICIICNTDAREFFIGTMEILETHWTTSKSLDIEIEAYFLDIFLSDCHEYVSIFYFLLVAQKSITLEYVNWHLKYMYFSTCATKVFNILHNDTAVP